MEATEVLVGVVVLMWSTAIGLHLHAMRRMDTRLDRLEDKMLEEIRNLEERMLAVWKFVCRGFVTTPSAPLAIATPRSGPARAPAP